MQAKRNRRSLNIPREAQTQRLKQQHSMCTTWSRGRVFVSQGAVGFGGVGRGERKEKKQKECTRKTQPHSRGDGKIKELGGRIPREDEFIQKSVIVTPNWSFIVSDKIGLLF